MTINPEAYQAITPYGPVQVFFPDDGGVEYDGPGAAVAYLQALISEQSGEDGRMLTPDSIDPLDLLNFCQPAGGRVQILPPLEEAMGTPRPATGTAPADATLDAVAPALQDLRDRLKAAEGIKAKVAVMGEIVAYLAAGIKAGGDTDTEFGLRARGKKTREKLNAQVAAITEQLRAGRLPASLTAEEIALLKQYSGKGGLTENSQFEYYTPTPLAEGTWDLLKANGFENGNVLEPSTGAGVFSATKPAGAIITGAEIDPTAATVNATLHPDDLILNQSFEKLAVSTPDNHFDAVVGNVPFGNVRGKFALDDPDYRGEKQIERYFLHRVIDKTRPGGLITLIVPTGVIGNTSGPWKKFRAAISRKAEFLGGHKLPSKTFGAQGTDVVTDIIVLRKHPADLLEKIDTLPVDLLERTNVLWDEFIAGRYWQGEGKRFIHGQYVPADKSKIRSMEQVIPEDGSTPESLKQKLAMRFESRIDWPELNAAEPVITYYAAGDRRIIGSKEMVFDGVSWAEVQYQEEAGGIDAEKYGVASMAALKSLAGSPEGLLELTSAQAFRVYKDFPNLLSPQMRLAVEFSQSQPLDAFREQAFRGSLIGSAVTRYLARAGEGLADDDERKAARRIVEDEFARYGHPRSAKGFYLEGEAARYFGAYLNAVNEDGKVSDALAGEVTGVLGYDPANARSVVEYLVKAKSDGLLTIENFKAAYAGRKDIQSLADVTEFEGVAITPDGFITTEAAYCCGEIYVKAGTLMSAMEDEPDPRIKAKYQAQIDVMMGKARRTGIEDISFGLRDKWVMPRYKLEFLKQEGYALRYMVQGEKESDTGETFIGNVDGSDSTDPNGTWVIEKYTRARSDFPNQLEHYMNGRSIGHNVREKGGESAEERTARFREQVNALEERFGHFMQTHNDFAEIERTYNLTFNGYVAPDRDTSDLGLEGVSPQVKLHWYQNQAVRQLSEEGTGILGHDVGLGKSYQAIAFSAYDRQMGRSKKHCIVVPKAVLANWYMESKKFLGNHSDVMFVGFEPKRNADGDIMQETVLDEHGQPKKNAHTGEIEMQDLLAEDSPAEVYQKMHQIPQSTVGLVIMTYEKFATIPLREESRARYAQQWAEKAMMSKADADKIGKSYQEAKSELKAEGEFANDGTKKKQELPYFEDMGFDRVIVDEAHCFPYDTKIATIDGAMSIGEIVDGRIETKVLSCDTATGELSYRDITGWMPKPMLTRMVRVDHVGGHFLCTENHLIWTVEEGYVEAGKLNRSHTLQVLRGEVHSEVSNSDFLQQGMRAEVDSLWDEGATDLLAMRDGILGGPDAPGSEEKAFLQHVVFSQVEEFDGRNEGGHQQGSGEAEGSPAWTVSSLLGSDEGIQPHVQPGCEGQDGILSQGAHAEVEGREWTPFGTSDSASDSAGGWVDSRTPDQHQGRQVDVRPSCEALQGGHRECGAEGSSGVGRCLSQFTESKGPGCQEGGHLVGSRVEGVSVLEPEDFERYGLGHHLAQVVYDIEVEGNHNFFAEGVLAHNCFKNSFSMGADATKLAYLPNPVPSQRARDMAMKTAWMRDKFDGKGTILLTATPVANSPIEIFNMLSLVIDQREFERLGIYTPDDFVRQFGMIQDVEKVRVSGEIVTTEGLAGFKNLNALRSLFHRYANMKNAADVDPNGDVLRLPQAVEMMTQATMSDEQHMRYIKLRDEAKDAANPQLRGKVRPMFAVIRDMDRVTTDMDLFNRTMTFHFKQADQSKLDALIAALPAKISTKITDEETGEKVIVEVEKEANYTLSGDTIVYVAPENYEDAIVGLMPKMKIDSVSHPLTPKYAKLLENMRAELDSKGKQIVFTEEKSQHGKLARLIMNNLPVSPAQVAIINATTADGEKLQQISDAYNRGDVRIIVANKKAEVGVNLQKGTSAIHHMTLPWNPASIQQRNGRGVRQGNTAPQVRVYYYQAIGSFDEYRLDLLKNKGNWIAALMDKKNTNDKAENAAAMGALEQAALLADNREEFLKMVADQKAAKAAEEKEKRDQAGKVKLIQLTNLTMRLANFDADKAKAQADADTAIAKAKAALEKAIAEEGEESDKAKTRRAQLQWSEARAGKVGAEWEKKKVEMESQRKQAASFLRGMAAKQTLPFDAAIIDDPVNALVTTSRLVVRVGSTYRIPGRSGGFSVVKVDTLNVGTRTVGVSPVVGYLYGSSFNADDLLEKAVEVVMTAEELETLKTLNAEHTYAGLAALGRAFVEKHLTDLKIRGEILVRDTAGALRTAYPHGEDLARMVFPDPADAGLKAQMVELFAAMEAGRTLNISTYAFASIAQGIYGTSWRDVLGESLKRASAADITAQASAIINRLAAGEPQSTPMEIMGLMAAFRPGYRGVGVRDLNRPLVDELNAWMTENGYVNVRDIGTGVNVALQAFNETQAARVEAMKAEAERLAAEAVKSHPDFKEVPAALQEAFRAIGIEAFYNTEDVETGGRYGSKAWPAFSMLFLKDRKGKNGRIFAVKEMLKGRFRATFCSEVRKGAAKYGDCTWVIPASNSPQDVFDLVS